MRIFDFVKNIDIWKIGLLIIIALLLFALGGYTIRTRWGTIAKEDLAKREMTKVKSQTNYALDMKDAMVVDLCDQYESTLRNYVIEKGYTVSYNRIKLDVKYYKLIAIAMSDVVKISQLIDIFIIMICTDIKIKMIGKNSKKMLLIFI